MDDLLSEFLTETAESIDVVDLELVKLEQDPNNKGVLDNIFRLVHTIKGTCGFLGLPRLEAVAHASENVLGKFRDGALEVTPPAVSLILRSLDRIKEILAGLAATEAEPAGDDTALIDELNDCAAGKLADAAVPAPQPAAPVQTLGRPLRPGEVSLEELEAAFNAAPGPEDMAAMAPTPETPAPEVPAAPVAEKTVREDARKVEDSKTAEAKNGDAQIANQSIRVNVDLLEDLMNMVSELVLSRNQLLQILRRHGDSEFAAPLQRLSQCTTELQEGVMKTRMQPIGNAWAKLPRIVRDLSHELHKKVDLQMMGAETELDRQVLEMIKDPLTHMVRNTADNGIESPKDRLAAGKPETGTIRLNAYHEGGHIIVVIADDGAGIKVSRLRQKIVEKGLATEADVAEMSDQQIQKFIFHPGFSTAEKVTNISGRGVGMDVVRSNIEKIGGTIELKSVEGRGTTFTIKIPLTLAIVSALIVKCGAECFAIPQISVLELVRVAPQSEHRIEHINQTPVLRLRDRLLPLVNLHDILNIPSDETEEKPEEESFIVVTQVGNFTFGIIVDRVFDTEEIVVKPVAPILRDIDAYSGNTILGDGSVIMILDPNGIASMAGSALSDSEEQLTAMDHEAQTAASNKEAMLIFRAGSQTPRAVPLSLVARLEEVAVDTIEQSNGMHVVQYRGGIMPLVLVDDQCALRDTGRQPVLVFSEGERSMGLVVDDIVDIVEDTVNIELDSVTPGLIGTAIVAEKATEIIDVSYYLVKAFGDRRKAVKAPVKGNARRVLVVDDSDFFRNMIKPLLSAAGYQVASARSAEEALQLRDQGEVFDVILSDIEMPGMDGFELASTIRSGGAWAATPVLALSSHASAEHMERGRAAGFNDYLAKYDREGLLESLSGYVGYKEKAA